MVECTRLEIWRTVLPYREFESHPLRQVTSKYAPDGAFCFFYRSYRPSKETVVNTETGTLNFLRLNANVCLGVGADALLTQSADVD